MGLLAWLPYLTADLGAIGAGILSGRAVKRGLQPIEARFRYMLPFAALMPLSIIIGYVPSRTLAMALICIVTMAHMGWKTNQVTLTNDIYPTPILGTAAGILAFANGLGGTLFTWATGYIVEYFGYNAIFFVMGILHPISYVVARLLVRRPLQEAA